jgi:hypothetical protein
MKDGNYRRLAEAVMDDAGGHAEDAARAPDVAAYKRALMNGSKPGAAPSHLADLHGRLAEAAAAPARLDPRPARGRLRRRPAA